MDILLLILIVLSGLLLIILVMLQDEGGEGLGGIFGGGSSTPFGSRSGTILTKITAVLAAVFLICTMGLAYMKRTPRESDKLLDYAREQKYEDSKDQLWYVETEPATEEPATSEEGAMEEGQTPETDDGAGLTEGYKQPEDSSTTDNQ
jgi:preprotein translocase subunit SecG